ncbi:PREDICTED: protein transport protein Sec31A-like [Branchiostoma belcheri]|uniref:Protein transport protein Sec31A n=1 Tax=Branchiostoma belcheri TaxID=7741 RepID=A0A6P4YDF6_BRABE|nr:PREDICTED: protein transport protein Sec31A-like [Branchiostoma belcheri]
MKVKDIERTANQAWSPAEHHPVYLAAGTAAQQLDATFSTSAALEIYQLNLGEPGSQMEPVGSISTEHRFHRLVWGGYNMGTDNLPSGVLVGGTDTGSIHIYNPAKLIKGEDPVFATTEKHSGPVRALDINPFQKNLLASGANDSEIFIWDLSNLETPMTPGSSNLPLEDISCVAWNQQVQHILGSSNPTGRCVVWDLRKNEPIIKVSDHSSRIRCQAIAWHPEVATQLVLASEDDRSPVIQLWDLRFATSPLKVLENHTRGILSVAWCPQDPDLLLSCAKDNRILCWNPNSSVPGGEVVYELPTSDQWSFDVRWCPRNPAVISSASFDGHISIYSLMGGGVDTQAEQQRQADKISSSFPGSTFGGPAPQPQVQQQAMPLKNPPKWLRRPVGASFAFGGKLVTFEHVKSAQQQQQQQPRRVFVSQVITEQELINRSNNLQTALKSGQFGEFCDQKIQAAETEFDQSVWSFLKVNFEADPRSQYLRLLGFDANELANKVAEATGQTSLQNGHAEEGVDPQELATKMQLLTVDTAGDKKLTSSAQGSPSVNEARAFTYNRKTPAEDSPAAGADVFDAIAAHGKDIATESQDASRPDSPFQISVDEGCDGLICRALLTGNFEAAVEMCLHDNRLAEALILSVSGGPELLARTQKKYFQRSQSKISRLLSCVVNRSWADIVQHCSLENWKEALAALLTYAKPEDFSALCGTLGGRLETEQDGQLQANACLTYICAGNVDKMVTCWNKITKNPNSPLALEDLVEKVMVLRKSIELTQKQAPAVSGGVLAEKLSQYAELLAAQGSLATAMEYLGDSTEPTIAQLRDRLYRAQGEAAPRQAQTAQRQAARPAGVQQQQHQYRQVGVTTTTSSANYYQPSTYPYASQQPAPTQQPNFTPAPQPAPAPAAPAAPGNANILTPPCRHNRGYHRGDQLRPASPSPSPSLPCLLRPPWLHRTARPPVDLHITNNSLHQPSRHLHHSLCLRNKKSGGNSGDSKPDRVQGAWNDPPAVIRARKDKQQEAYTPPAPITAPIPLPPEDQAAMMNQEPPGAPIPAAVNQPQAGAQQYNYGQTYAAPPASNPPQQQSSAPTTPKEKGPIPAEHQELAQSLDSLLQRCLSTASHPQTKRKLEDVSRRLEALYDKLRDNSLPAPILTSLHQLSAACSQQNYQAGLNIHTQMIQASNFSQISSFMTGLKVLMQVASQHNV